MVFWTNWESVNWLFDYKMGIYVVGLISHQWSHINLMFSKLRNSCTEKNKYEQMKYDI